MNKTNKVSLEGDEKRIEQERLGRNQIQIDGDRKLSKMEESPKKERKGRKTVSDRYRQRKRQG